MRFIALYFAVWVNTANNDYIGLIILYLF